MSPLTSPLRGQFAQQAAHDFAAAGFGQRVGEADVVGLGQRADLFATHLRSSSFSSWRGLVPALERDERRDGLAL